MARCVQMPPRLATPFTSDFFPSWWTNFNPSPVQTLAWSRPDLSPGAIRTCAVRKYSKHNLLGQSERKEEEEEIKWKNEGQEEVEDEESLTALMSPACSFGIPIGCRFQIVTGCAM